MDEKSGKSFSIGINLSRGQVAIERPAVSARNLPKGQVAIERPAVSARNLPKGQVAIERPAVSARNLPKGQVAIVGTSFPSGNLKAQVAIARTSSSARNLRAQVAIEFFMYTGIFLFVLLASFAIIELLQASEIPAQEARILREQGDSVAQTMQLAVLAGEGFSHHLTLPKRLLGRPYTIDFDGDKAVLVLNGTTSAGTADYIYPLPPYSYRFTGCLGSNGPTGSFTSNRCNSTLTLSNDGNTLRIDEGQVE